MGEAEERSNRTAEANKAAEVLLRDTARWIATGIAVAAGGVVAGTSLSSLGSLDLEFRLGVAFFAAAVGLGSLGFLLWSTIKVLSPRSRIDLRDIALREAFSDREAGKILPKFKDRIREVEHIMAEKLSGSVKPCKPEAATQPRQGGVVDHRSLVLDYCNRYEEFISSRSPSEEDKRAIVAMRHQIYSNIMFEYEQLRFRALLCRAFILAPIIAFAFGCFAWAANPPKDDPKKVTPIKRAVPVDPHDVAFLKRALILPSCVGEVLEVIILAEWRSGAQQIVTVPKAACLPTRLRLDHGRFSPD